MNTKILKIIITALITTTQTSASNLENSFHTLEQMQKKIQHSKTFTAQFLQRQKNVALGTTKESSGRIYIKIPRQFRWDTLLPDPSIMVSNGKKVWYYTAPYRNTEHGQVMIKKAADTQSQLAIDLLSGQGNLKKNFNIKTLNSKNFYLTPLKPAGDIAHIELALEKSTNLIYKLTLFTITGNQTELMLKEVTLGLKLPDSMFNFITPPQTEEIQ